MERESCNIKVKINDDEYEFKYHAESNSMNFYHDTVNIMKEIKDKNINI